MEVKIWTYGKYSIRKDSKMRHNSWQVYFNNKWHSWFDTFKAAKDYVLRIG